MECAVCILQVSRLLPGDGQSGVRVRRGVTPGSGGSKVKGQQLGHLRRLRQQDTEQIETEEGGKSPR